MLKYWMVLLLITLSSPAFSKNILWIGDSHSVGFFGQTVRTELSKTDSLSFVASCGANSDSYLQKHTTDCGFTQFTLNPKTLIKTKAHSTPRLEALVKKEQPDELVIALGTNFLNMTPDSIEKSVMALLEKAKVSSTIKTCIWVGPPDALKAKSKQIQVIDQTLRNILAKSNCKYISSLPLTQYPSKTEVHSRGEIPDPMGIHYPQKEGQDWATKVVKEIKKITPPTSPAPPKPPVISRPGVG